MSDRRCRPLTAGALGVRHAFDPRYNNLGNRVASPPGRLYTTLGFVQYCAHRYDQAIELYEKALELDPNFFQAYIALGYAYSFKSLHDRNIAEMQKGIARTQGGLFIAWLGETYARAGHPGEAENILGQLHESSKRQGIAVGCR